MGRAKKFVRWTECVGIPCGIKSCQSPKKSPRDRRRSPLGVSRRTCPDQWGSLCPWPVPVPRSSFQWQCPLASNRRLPHASFLTHPTHQHTRPIREPPFFSHFAVFISSLLLLDLLSNIRRQIAGHTTPTISQCVELSPQGLRCTLG